MIAISLQSGSNGNCIYVEHGGVRLLFDAGISGIKAQQRLAGHGRDIGQVDAVIISHDHSDHVRCAGVYQRKFKLPIYATASTMQAATAYVNLGKMEEVRTFASGDALDFGSIRVQTIRTPHDASDGVAFVIEAGGKRVGILTDLGHVFDGLPAAVGSLDGVFLESNYDPRMLATGPYPEFLKARIRGPRGHISNEEAAALLLAAAGGQLRWACLAHLSEQNNDPKVAMSTHQSVIQDRIPLHVASRYEASDIFEL